MGCGKRDTDRTTTKRETLLEKSCRGAYFVLQIALRGGYIEPAVHSQHAHVESVELESGAKALAHSLCAECKGVQQPHLHAGNHNVGKRNGARWAERWRERTGSFIFCHMEVNPMATIASSTTRQNMR
jgi:hypothetical protein